MNLRRLFAASGFVLVFALLSPAQEEKPPVVPYLHPVPRQVPRQYDIAGRIDAPRVDLRARVSGYLEKVHFVEGAEVKEGDLLFEIDSRPYRLELERAEAQLRVGEARLRKVEAELGRVRALAIKGAASQEELGRATAERAEVEAELAVGKAALQLAKLYMDYTQVRAPVSGRVGRRLVDVGNLVKADESLLGTLVGKPSRVVFSVFDSTATQLRREAEKRGQTLEKAGLPVEFALSDEAEFSHKARLDLVDTTMTTGEQPRLVLGATIQNPHPLLSPGMSVRLRLLADEMRTVWEIPQNALEEKGSFRVMENSVLVLDADNRVQRKRVLLRSLGTTAVVTSGLTEKDRVVPPDRGLKVGMVVTPMKIEEANPK